MLRAGGADGPWGRVVGGATGVVVTGIGAGVGVVVVVSTAMSTGVVVATGTVVVVVVVGATVVLVVVGAGGSVGCEVVPPLDVPSAGGAGWATTVAGRTASASAPMTPTPIERTRAREGGGGSGVVLWCEWRDVMAIRCVSARTWDK